MTTIAVAVLALAAFYFHARSIGRLREEFHAQSNLQHDRYAKHLQQVIAQKNPDLEQLIGLIDRQMQRIQAPQQAVMDHSVSVAVPSPPAIPFDDDDAFFRSRNMTVDELADAEMRAEVTSVAA